MKIRLVLLTAVLGLSVGCLQFESSGNKPQEPKPETAMEKIQVPPGFLYKTSFIVESDLIVESAVGVPAANHPIRAYAPSEDGTALEKNLFFSGRTDANGKVATSFRIPAHWDTVLISLNANGSNPTSLPVKDGKIVGKITL